MKKSARVLLILVLLCVSIARGRAAETLPALQHGKAPENFDEMWSGFDPRAEPLETETIKEWEEDDVVLRIVRFRIGVFKGKKATLAAVYGFPKSLPKEAKIPGLVQIHGGGQYADYKACLANAKRGYATISIAWAGRISAPGYLVNANVVKLFWDGKFEDPAYKRTTDWGALDGYHAPGRHAGNVFPSAKPAAWTLDAVESPRNSGWFLAALAARRALTFLERQPEVAADKLGVYGHSMGGKLTVMTAFDSRVKAAAPSCGGISDRVNSSPLFRATLGDDVSLRRISCPIIFLSPANDFHGRIGDLPSTIKEISSQHWRVTCSPHHNHQDTPPFEVATLLWFDQHLKGTFSLPKTPKAELQLDGKDRVPRFVIEPDTSQAMNSIDVFYTQQGLANETPRDRELTMHRHWRHVRAVESNGRWLAELRVLTTDKPIWVFANIDYQLKTPVSGAGYYYGSYTANTFNLSSMLQVATPRELKTAKVLATLKPSMLIEDFQGDWEKEWFTYKPDDWARTTHKLNDDAWKPPAQANLVLEVRAPLQNRLVVMMDQHAAEVQLKGGAEWQRVELSPKDARNFAGESLTDWHSVKRFKLSPAEHLKPKRGQTNKPRVVGGHWRGAKPEFRNLRWELPN